METLAATMFPIGLLFFAGFACLGIRRERAPYWILPALAFACLAYWGGQFLMDLARHWSGLPRLQTVCGYEAYAAMLYVAIRHQTWVAVGQHRRQRFARVSGGSHANR